MFVVINGRFLTQKLTGVQRFACELVKALDALIGKGIIDPKYSLLLITPSGTEIPFELSHIRVQQAGLLAGHLWEQFELPLYARRGVLLNLCNSAPLLKTHQLVVIHDAAVYAVPHAYSVVFRAWYKFMLPLLGKKARHLITVSQFSRSELVRYCGYDEAKITVVQEGSEHILAQTPDNTILQRTGIGDRPFILAVSSLTPNKNFGAVARAIGIIGSEKFHLVVAGSSNPKVFSTAQTVLPDFVKYAGYVSEAELRALFESAACFVYPSFYEGFGLPPLEAMACGCPVIVSKAASLPEVCGHAALYCDPYDHTDIAEKIVQVLHDRGKQDDMRRKGLKQAAKYTWEKAAISVWAVVEKIITR